MSNVDQVEIETHRTMLPVLQKMHREGYRLVGLEQATNSIPLYNYEFSRKSLLLVGNERQGIPSEELAILDDVVERELEVKAPELLHYCLRSFLHSL